MPGFEQLLAWQVPLQLSKELDPITRSGSFRGDSPLAVQLRKAAVSISSNVAEGHGRGKRAEFAHFLMIARGSAVEVQSQLVVALAAGRLTLHQFHSLRALADRCVALITKLHASVIAQAERDE
jgi:four helix bundle protein